MSTKEKRGGLFLPNPSRDKIENIMVDHNLIDINPRNEKYNWIKKQARLCNIKEIF